MEDLEALGFYLVGLRLHDVHRELRPAAGPDLEPPSSEHDLVVARCSRATATSRAASVPTVRANYLASPPLVVAYAIAGTVDIDLTNDPIGTDRDGNDVIPGATSGRRRPRGATRQSTRASRREQFIEQYA